MQDKLELVRTTIAPYVNDPLTVTMIEPGTEDGVLASSELSVDDDVSLEVSISQTLMNGPVDALRYIAATQSLQYVYENDHYLYLDEYPPRIKMAKIRELLKRTGDYPFRLTAAKAYEKLAIDKYIRAHSPYSITDETVAWIDSLKRTGASAISWQGRLLIQQHDAEIWG